MQLEPYLLLPPGVQGRLTGLGGSLQPIGGSLQPLRRSPQQVVASSRSSRRSTTSGVPLDLRSRSSNRVNFPFGLESLERSLLKQEDLAAPRGPLEGLFQAEAKGLTERVSYNRSEVKITRKQLGLRDPFAGSAGGDTLQQEINRTRNIIKTFPRRRQEASTNEDAIKVIANKETYLKRGLSSLRDKRSRSYSPAVQKQRNLSRTLNATFPSSKETQTKKQNIPSTDSPRRHDQLRFSIATPISLTSTLTKLPIPCNSSPLATYIHSAEGAQKTDNSKTLQVTYPNRKETKGSFVSYLPVRKTDKSSTGKYITYTGEKSSSSKEPDKNRINNKTIKIANNTIDKHKTIIKTNEPTSKNATTSVITINNKTISVATTVTSDNTNASFSCKSLDRSGKEGTQNTQAISALPWRRSDYLKESQHKQHLQHKQQDTCLTVTGQERPEVSVTDTDDERRLLAPSPISRVSPLSQSEWDIRRSWGAHVGGEIGLADGVECSSLSQSVCRLAQRVERGDEAPLCLERGEDAPLSLPFISTSSSASSTQSTQEGMFQKFKKSLSLRLHKKSLRGSIAPPEATPPPPTPPNEDELLPPEGMTFPRRRGSAGGVEDSRNFIFGHPIFRSSKERRRGGPQNHRERRASKCNSGDSGDSGIELTNGSGVSKGGEASHSRSPHSSPTGNRETTDNAPPTAVATALPPPIEPCMRRAWSEVGGSIASHAHENPTIVSHHQPVSYGRQNSSPQPLKLRPKHLPNNRSVGSMQRPGRLKRSFASSRLRRSASQPLDLDRVTNPPPTPSSSSPNEQNTSGGPKASNGIRKRRPSFGNLLSDEESSAEEEEEEEELNEGGCVGMSDCEGYRKDLKRCLEEEDLLVYAEALWDHVTLDSDELVFKAGDLITVVENSDRDWWWGRISHRAGWFPAAFVRLLVNQGDHADSLQSGRITSSQWLRNGRTLPSFSHEQIRANVINEIITTERDFVKHLRDVVHGYLKQVRKRQDMFSKECVAAIFGNIEALYEFQSNFFQDLEQCIDYEHTDRSCIGQCFIRNRAKFEIYSEYCNNHPNAVSQLQELYLQQKYVHFFEACRLLQAMIDISLDGFLLTPVQKICKYPLQLQELLKYTKPSHPDYSHVQGALEAMKQVALMVNERKRRMECLEKIACWQMAVEGWEGPDLLDDSSQLIEQGEATKGAFSSWPKEVTLFLFDHQLIYCKRDLLKRNTFVYRGRINLDLCEITDIPHGRAESSKSGTVHHAWKVHCLNKSKTYVFSCKSIGEKQKWLCAFRRERELVAADETAGFVVSEKAKQVAKTAARNHRNRPKRPRSLWFSFAGPKKSRGYRRVQHPPAPHPPPQAV